MPTSVKLTEAVAGYVAAAPARLTDAAWAAAKADTLALRDHANSLPAHIPLFVLAQHAFHPRQMVEEARRMIHLGHTLSFDAIQYDDVPLIFAWQGLLEVAFVQYPDSVLSIAQQAKEDLGRFPLGSEFPDGVPYAPIQLFDFKNATPIKVRNFLLPFNPQQYEGTHTLPPVVASYWSPAAPKTWPPKGTVSLVLYGGWIMSCAREDGNILDFPLSTACAPLHTYLPRWITQYDSLGFALTLVERTQGHAVRSVTLSPSSEADTLNWYYRKYLKLSATVAVVPQAVSTQLSAPDNRRWLVDTTAFGRMLGPTNSINGRALLFDQDGVLLYAGTFGNNTLTLIHALIVRALHAPKVDKSNKTKAHE
jgi:hypothetical protein